MINPFPIQFIDDFRVLAIMANCTRDGNVTHEARIALLAGHGTTRRSDYSLQANATTANITALVCQPSYSIRKYLVRAERENLASVVQETDGLGLSALDMWKAFHYAVSSIKIAAITAMPNFTYGNYELYAAASSSFMLMLQLLQPEFEITETLNPDVLQT